MKSSVFFFFFQAEDGIRDVAVTGVQTCALPILSAGSAAHDGAAAGNSQRAASHPPVHRDTSTAVSSPETADQPDLLQRLKHSAIQFARLTQVADCLHTCAALPCGYYMEAPQSPIGLEPDEP